MANVAENMSVTHRPAIFGRVLAEIRSALQKRRVYKQTYTELSNLSTRELDDLGISRSMISRLAYEAANKV